MTRTLRHKASIPQKIDRAVKFEDLIEKLKVKFADTLRWTVSAWANRISGQFRDIQEIFLLILHCKTMYCCRMTSPSTSTTSGTPTRCTQLFKSGLITEGKSNRTDRQSVFFTAVNPMDIQPDQREVEYDLDKPRIAPYRHLEISSQYTILVQFKACSKKGIAILSNSIERNYSFRNTTQRSVSIKWFAWKQGKNFSTSHPEYPAWHLCRTLNTFRRMYMFQNRENPMTVRMKFSAQGNLWQWPLCWFSNPWHSTFRCWTSWNKSNRKSSTINWAIRKSPKQEHVAEGLQEIRGDQPRQSRIKGFDYKNGQQRNLRVLRSKRQCPDCALYWEIGIVFCTWGKCMQPSERHRQLNKDWFDSVSLLGYVMKKNQPRGPRHGQSVRQIMCHKTRDMLRKAKLPKNGSCETILERWSTDASHCLMKVGQKRKSDSTTHLLWRTVPMKLLLQKGDDGKGTGKLI